MVGYLNVHAILGNGVLSKSHTFILSRNPFSINPFPHKELLRATKFCASLTLTDNSRQGVMKSGNEKLVGEFKKRFLQQQECLILIVMDHGHRNYALKLKYHRLFIKRAELHDLTFSKKVWSIYFITHYPSNKETRLRNSSFSLFWYGFLNCGEIVQIKKSSLFTFTGW